MNAARCALLAKAASAVYDRRPTLTGYTPYPIFGRSTESFVFIGEKETIVAFRGTDSVADLALDVKAWRVRVPGLGGLWHRGFVRAVSSVYSQIVSRLIFTENGRTLWLTGHSLGGAAAVLCAARLEAAGHKVDGVLTMGAPRVAGALASAKANKLLGDRVVRVENLNDRVPHLPWAVLGYRHVGSNVLVGTRVKNRVLRALLAVFFYPIRATRAHAARRYLRLILEEG